MKNLRVQISRISTHFAGPVAAFLIASGIALLKPSFWIEVALLGIAFWGGFETARWALSHRTGKTVTPAEKASPVQPVVKNPEETTSYAAWEGSGFLINPVDTELRQETVESASLPLAPLPLQPVQGEVSPRVKTGADAEIEKYFIQMFGQIMGPFTETEIRHGISAQEFPADATISEEGKPIYLTLQDFKSRSGCSAPQMSSSPPPFRARAVPPPFRRPKPSDAA